MAKREKEKIYQKQDEHQHLELLWRLRDEDTWKENLAPGIKRKIENGEQLSNTDKTNIYLYAEPGDYNKLQNHNSGSQNGGLHISEPHEAEEKEADDIARKIVNGEKVSATQNKMQFPEISRKEADTLFEEKHPWAKNIDATDLIQRKEDDQLMRKSGDGELQGTDQLKAQLDSTKGSGQPLAENLRTEMESKMGTELGDVSIHNNSKSDELAKGVNAKAFTYGQDIYFKQGQYNPESKDGKELLAHEVVHTKQQLSGGVFAKLFRKVNPEIEAMEKEMDAKITLLEKEQMLITDKKSKAYDDIEKKIEAYEAMKKEMRKEMKKDSNFTWNPENYRTYLQDSKYHQAKKTGEKGDEVVNEEIGTTAGSNIEKEERLVRFDTFAITKADLDQPTRGAFTQTTFVEKPTAVPDGKTPRQLLEAKTSEELINYSNAVADAGVKEAINNILSTQSSAWTLDKTLEYAGTYKYTGGSNVIINRLETLMTPMSVEELFDIRYNNPLVDKDNANQIALVESGMNKALNTKNEFLLYVYMQKTSNPIEKAYLTGYFQIRFQGDAYTAFIETAQNKYKGHAATPQGDYTEGEIRDEGPIYAVTKAGSKTTVLGETKQPLFFLKGDKVKLENSSGTWIYVSGNGHYIDKGETKSAEVHGWILRSTTDMTLGKFYGLEITDLTSDADYGKLTSPGSSMPASNVHGIILHQTALSTKAQTLAGYDARIKGKSDIGAHYLISSSGEIILTGAINEHLSHAPIEDKKKANVKLTKPDSYSVSAMQTIKKEIQSFYDKKEIPFDVYDRLYNMESKALYTYLKDVNKDNPETGVWYIYPYYDLGNTQTIGIEVVAAPRFIDIEIDPTRQNPPSEFSEEAWADTRARIMAMEDITDADKRTALHQDERDAIENSTDTQKYPDEDAKKFARMKVDRAACAELKKKNWMIGGVKVLTPLSSTNFGGNFSSVSPAVWNNMLTKIFSLTLSPEYRKQLKITLLEEIKNKLDKQLYADDKEKASLSSDFTKYSAELYGFLRPNGFKIYEDITPAQKYATWLLVSKLTDRFNLNKKEQVYEHPAVGTQGIGEGQGNMEFIREMTDVDLHLTEMRSITDVTFKAKIARYLSIQDKLNNNIQGDPIVLDFFANFYVNKDEIQSLYNSRPQ